MPRAIGRKLIQLLDRPEPGLRQELGIALPLTVIASGDEVIE
jgi:hypothetical protein